MKQSSHDIRLMFKDTRMSEILSMQHADKNPYSINFTAENKKET